MKAIGLILKALTVIALSSGIACADCTEDCDGPFQTCLNLCRQTTTEDSPEAAKCANHCLHGVSGCVKKCEAKDKQSENTSDCKQGNLVDGGNHSVLASNCIEKDRTCILNGTPCCDPYECKGKFPNTYCQ